MKQIDANTINEKGILIVEDEFIIAQDISNEVNDWFDGLVEVACNFDEALTCLFQKDIGLVLLDINLGEGKNGLDLAKLLNEEFKVPFILITSNYSKPFLDEIKTLNPAGFLSKPFKNEDIKTVIELSLYKNAYFNVNEVKKEKENLLELSSLFNIVHDKEQLVEVLQNHLRKYFDYEDAMLFLINEASGYHYNLISLFSEQSTATYDNGYYIPKEARIETAGSAMEVLFHIGSTSLLHWKKDFIDKGHTHSCFQSIVKKKQYFAMGSPIEFQGKRLGFLVLSAAKPNFSEKQLPFFSSLSDLLALSLSNILFAEEVIYSKNKNKFELKIAKAISKPVQWEDKLEEVASLLQFLVSFDLLVINIEMDENKCPTYAYYRVGKNEYQKFMKEDLLEITGLDDNTFLSIRKKIIKTYDNPFVMAGTALRENNKNNVIKGRICSHFKFQSNFIFPLKLDRFGKVIFSFYSRKDDFFSQEQIDLMSSFENTLRIVFDRSLALEEIEKLNKRLELENKYLIEEVKGTSNFETIIGQSSTLKEVFNNVELVAKTDTTVLITGETGTGKELIAHAIHNLSTRVNKSLIKINCAALPAQLIESELFGHEKGSFTGAFERKIGKFEFAHKGSIFLDEIGELPLELQSKLLRVLQEKEFERVGGRETIKSDVRIMAATNRDLMEEVNKGKFRSDLFYRLHVFPIHLPALRERKDDIPLLATFFGNKYALKMGKTFQGIKERSMQELIKYDWPGNIRELENVIEQAVIVNQNKQSLELARELLHVEQPKNTSSQLNLTDNQISNLPKSMIAVKEEKEAYERKLIIETLQKTKGRIRGKKGAALLLNILPTTLESKMKRYGIFKDEFDRL